MEDTAPRRHPNVLNVEEAPSFEVGKGTRYGATIRQLGAPTGGQRVGCNWFEVPPGRTAFPRHWHAGVEEVIFVLQGRGTLRIGDEQLEVAPGDYVTLPIGPEHAHQLLNSGDEPLCYLCLSSKAPADVVGYPDSDKISAQASPSPNYLDQPWVRAVFRADSAVGYYEGEED